MDSQTRSASAGIRRSRTACGLPNGPRRLDVDDHTVVGVDQIVGGVGEESMPLMHARPLGCRIRSGNELRRDRGGRAERRVVERGEIFTRGANRALLDLLRLPVLAWNRALLSLIAAEKTGRVCRGVELDALYVSM